MLFRSAVVHQNAVTHATAESVAFAVAKNQKWQALADYEEFDAYVANGGYQLLKQIHSQSIAPEDIIQTMESSGLRGLGGAGFPAGRKWRIVREQVAPRLMAVNIDEGEPGTFKDRTYLERDPHRFIEGMLIAIEIQNFTISNLSFLNARISFWWLG